MREIKAVLLGDDEPAYLDQNSKLLMRAARRTARAIGLLEKDVVVGRQGIQWFPWLGSRALITLSLLAKAAKIIHETDQLSITYRLPSLEAFREHLRTVGSAPPDAVVLARLLPVKATEKFDDFVPEQLLDEANAQSRLSKEEAIDACNMALS